MDWEGQESSFVKINEINSSVAGGIMVGLVIAKHKSRVFPDSKGGPNRRVFSFTLRDSRRDTTNVHVWGAEVYVQQMEQIFCINDCVKVSNFQVHLKNDSEAKFSPTTTSDFSIHLSEKNNGVIIQHTGHFLRIRSKFEHAPICKENDFYTLLEASEAQENSQYVNLLVCIRKVGKVQNITSKQGKELCKVELTLLDETLDSFPLTIWDENACGVTQRWMEMSTIIFITDVLVGYNNYRKSVAASSTSKTVFICNPDTNEAHHLYQYAQELSKTMVVDNIEEVDGNSEATVKTIEKIKQLLTGDCQGPASIRAVVYGAITQLDIDSFSSRLHSYRCTSCGYTVDEENTTLCRNSSCLTSTQGVDLATTRDYDIRASIADHTGLLSHCRINSRVSESMFEIPLEDFMTLSYKRRTAIKWNWLLERCKLTVKCSLTRNGNPFTILEACTIASHNDLIQMY